ncbi:MAG: DNA mismatch repair endonuclease MutL [Peptococcaceae bacterium]|nr:DNA mismatch repair endonuclease MutL [Peptococcaceae bacterium]
MPPRIKLLDQHCINQIAAGEVVERPLSVVKELIENAIDAGANKIEISVEGGGQSQIRVRDNGCGMAPEDLQLAVLPHATSKIAKIDDLNNLASLGFRGEALPTIAAISKLSIVSRRKEDAVGWEIRVEGGQVASFAETGCAPGTDVTVSDLFYNTPARRKFLRSANTEFGLISDMVSRLALANPSISFSLRHARTLVLNTTGRGNLLDTIAAVLGNEIARKMLPLEVEDQGIKVAGYIGSPEQVRKSRNGVTFIVNGRFIRSQLLYQSLKEGYHTLIPAGTYPYAVLTLTMPPAFYDVNVHPSKLEIKFKDEKVIFNLVSNSIRKTLLEARPVRSLQDKQTDYDPQNFHDYQKDQNYQNTTKLLSPRSRKIAEPHKFYSSTPTVADSWEQLKLLYKPAPGLTTDKSVKVNKELYIENQEQNQDKKSEQVNFEELRALGQLFNTYILCTDDQDLYIIDQHAAHERIRYDNLRQQLNEKGVYSQMLLIPETVELTIQEEQIMLEHFEQLNQLGFIIENFGERTYFLRAVPIVQNLPEPGKLLIKFLDEVLSKSIPPTQEKLMESWLDMIACRSALKGNAKLSLQEMDQLIQELGNRPNPLSCPHGRPTMINISKKELEDKFNRT